MKALEYVHVDVFSPTPYSGNSLPVFTDGGGLSAEQMLRITRELRHFEAAFLEPTAAADTVRARVFDLFEELPFAGHPLIGAAATLHQASGRSEDRLWQIELPGRVVSITTSRTPRGFFGVLDQGAPEFLGVVDQPARFAPAVGLEPHQLHPALPLEVVSTGLRYLIIPVVPGALERACIRSDITEALRPIRAQFAVLFDEAALEIRHWNNDGVLEDVATGSAAGTIGAYRLRHGLCRSGEPFLLHQGRFAGRPSTLRVEAVGSPDDVRAVSVGGDVAIVGRGVLEAVP